METTIVRTFDVVTDTDDTKDALDIEQRLASARSEEDAYRTWMQQSPITDEEWEQVEQGVRALAQREAAAVEATEGEEARQRDFAEQEARETDELWPSWSRFCGLGRS